LITAPLFPKEGKRYTFNQADPVPAGLRPPKLIRDSVAEFGRGPQEGLEDWAYATPVGPEDVRQKIVEGLKARHGCPHLTIEDVYLSTGSVAGELLPIIEAMSFVDHGAFMTPDPYYPSYYGVPRFYGMKVVTYDLKPPEYRLTRECLEKNWSPDVKYICFTNPNNPTGRNFDLDEQKVFFDFCREKQITVISDEVYWSCLYGGAKMESYMKHGLAHGVEVLLVQSFSKSFAVPGVRAGYMVKLQTVPGGRLEKVWDRIRQFLMLHISCSTFAIFIMRKILENYPMEYFENAKRCETCFRTMERRFNESPYVRQVGRIQAGIIGVHQFALPKNTTSLELAMEWVKVGVGALPAFCISQQPEMVDGWMRMTNMLSEEDANDACDRMLGVLERMHKERGTRDEDLHLREKCKTRAL
jgi:aspartate/methionine/tyrosine aminotransferase